MSSDQERPIPSADATRLVDDDPTRRVDSDDLPTNCAPETKASDSELIVVTANGGMDHWDELFAAVITNALPEVSVRFVPAKTTSFAEILALPELRVASLFVTMINNLYRDGTDDGWLECRLDFVRQLRKRTNAVIFVTSGMWGPDFRDRLRHAGADFVEQAPFKITVLNEVARAACRQWQGGTRLAGEAYRTQIVPNRTRVAGAGYQSILATQFGAPSFAGRTERYKIGDRIGGQYEVLAIHHGSMGVVYGTFDHKEQLPRALKTLQERFASKSMMRELFAEEAATWVRLEKHPFIVRAYLVEEYDGQPYVITEYVRGEEDMGENLQAWLGHPRLTFKLAVEMALQIAQGMQHAGRKIPGLVHHDLKPANILVDSRARAMVTDFGLVGAAETEAGTPAYMAPEQWRGESLDPRTDIYAFGCILYEMFTGHRMFAAETFEQWKSEHLTRMPIAPRMLQPDLPKEIEDIVMKCLAKIPEERPRNWDEVVNELAALFHWLTGQPAVLDFSAYELNAEELCSASYSLSRLKKFDEMLSTCDRVLEIEPSYAVAWYNKGVALYNLKRYDEAIACWNRALEIEPNFADAWNNKGGALYSLKRYDEAIASYDRALEINPAHTNAWIYKGLALGNLNRHEEAITCYDRSLGIDPSNARAWYNKGDALANLKRCEEAIACYDRSLEIDPSNAATWYNKGNALAGLNRYEEALTCYDRTLEIDPIYSELARNCSDVAQKLRNQMKAAQKPTDR